MNSSNVGNGIFLAETEIPDPGNGKTIAPDASLAVCNLVSAAAETRTLDRPAKQGVLISLHMRTDGGDITVTVTGGYNAAGATTIVFTDIQQFVVLQSFRGADGVLYWRQISNSNTGNSPIAPGAALTAAKPAFTIADAEGTPDNAIAAVTNSTAFGFSNAAELITLLYKVQNLYVRVGEIEARLEAAGIVTAN